MFWTKKVKLILNHIKSSCNFLHFVTCYSLRDAAGYLRIITVSFCCASLMLLNRQSSSFRARPCSRIELLGAEDVIFEKLFLKGRNPLSEQPDRMASSQRGVTGGMREEQMGKKWDEPGTWWMRERVELYARMSTGSRGAKAKDDVEWDLGRRVEHSKASHSQNVATLLCAH